MRASIALPRLALLQGALLLTSRSAWLLASHERVDTALGVINLVLLGMGATAIHAAYGVRRAAALLAQDHRRLALVDLENRRQIDRLQAEANDVKAVMERAQRGLEQRIDESAPPRSRTARAMLAQHQAVTDSLTRRCRTARASTST